MRKEVVGADKYHHSQRSSFWKGLRRLLGGDCSQPLLKTDIWNITQKSKKIRRSGK